MSDPASDVPSSGESAPVGFPLSPMVAGPLPGEDEGVAAAESAGGVGMGAGTGEIPLARDVARPGGGEGDRKPVAVGKAIPQPKLAERDMWPVVQETKGRRFFAVMVMLGVVGLYAWMLSCYYAGAHGGVDQAGYLMTARLIVGEYNVGNPKTTAKPTVIPPTRPELPAKEAPSIWPGGEWGYVTDVHPRPSVIQRNETFDWLRNRLSFVPDSPFEFASRMCVITEPYGPASPDVPAGRTAAAAGKPAEYRVYAKYPFGFSLMAAAGREVAGLFDKKVTVVPAMRAKDNAAGAVLPEAGTQPVKSVSVGKTQFERVGRGIDGMYIINPLCTVLACYFAYFMFRQAVSSFMALIGVIWLACNPLVLVYANDANSHASSLFCVCMGFWGVLSFLRTGAIWRAWIGGLALGYCCTIRYSEFLLVLPVVFAAAINLRPTWKSAIGSLSLLVAWAIPVGALAFVCWIAFGSPAKTGYTYCNEDTGFGWKYLTGAWEDRDLTGNWETLVTQVNRIGLFVMWPLALAGLMGMLGAAWRLGVTIALWVVPSMALYLLYYWAPGGDTTTGYLRFYVTIMPGLIFAGVWLLDRALSYVPGEKRAGLAIGTLLGVFLLVVMAFFADGGPTVIDGGLKKTVVGLITQSPGALLRLVTHSWMGVLCAGTIVAAVIGMWVFDRHVIAGRLGVALGAGAITALGCAINLETIVPSLDRSFANNITLRQTVDNMREILPRGSVVICDDGLLQQLDCIGGWKLYNSNVFSPAMYNQSITKLAQRNTPERMDDPDPLQVERSEFYKELLSMPSSVATITLGPRNAGDLLQLEKAVIEKNLAAGRRVTLLELADPGDAGIGGAGGAGGGGRPAPVPDGLLKVELRRWTVSAPPAGPTTGGAAAAFGAGGRGGRGGGRGAGRGNNGAGIGVLLGGGAGSPGAAGNALVRQGPTYVLYELVKH